MTKRCYTNQPPGVDLENLKGKLIVIEGPDCSGRTTQVSLLSQWLEQKGHAVAQVGLKRSELVSRELEQAMEGNVLSPRTMSLFYATDFYDQLENNIIPALRAGYIVLADRYIFTLIARDIVRGANSDWLESLYSMAIIPDAVFYLVVSASALVERALTAYSRMDYWESGMDIGHSRDWFESFIWYQRRMRMEFKKLQQKHAFQSINANRTIAAVQREIRTQVETMLDRSDVG
jgi:dTMP kinase